MIFNQLQKESDEMKSKLMELLKRFKLANKTSKIAAAPPSEPTSPRLSLSITPPPKIERDSREMITTKNSNIYALGHVIREGKFGPVRMGELIGSADDKEIESGNKVAIKLCSISKMEEMKSLEDPFSELEILKEIGEVAASTNNPHLVGLIDSCIVGDYLYLVMPLFEDGDLLDVLENKFQGTMSSGEVKKMFQQMLLALQSMHSRGLIHRDLSLENILYDEKKNIYALCDFGLSMKLNKEESSNTYSSLKNYHITGKTMYIAPEFWKREKEIDGMSADIWSLGVILFMTLTGIAPFKRAHDMDSNYRLIQEKGLREIFAESNLPTEAMEGLCLVQEMLHVDPSQRPTAEQLLNHSWFN